MSVDTIYYINLASNVERNLSMKWLFQAPVPVFRLEGVRNSHLTCVPKHGARWCTGAAGLATVHDRLLTSHEKEGFVAVFEDDFHPLRELWWKDMNSALQRIPPPWDVVRFDCWGSVPHTFRWLDPHTFQTYHSSACTASKCSFCGGTHALVYNMSARNRIRNNVYRVPIDDIDCRMSQAPWGKRNYCHNSNIFGRTHRFSTDIPKRRDTTR